MESVLNKDLMNKIFIVALVVVVCFSMVQCGTVMSENNQKVLDMQTRRMEFCVSNGGSWLDHNCIQTFKKD